MCAVPCPDDGVIFDAGALLINTIRVDQPDGGLRARLPGALGNIRLSLQMDIGFGDMVTPARELRDYPTLLDLPAPRLWTYPREAMVAEKFHAMVSRGEINSRVKDLWDIACLARRFAFDGETLRRAVAETFRRSATTFTADRPPALRPAYYEDPARRERWRVLHRQIPTGADGPARLADAGVELSRFLGPLCDSLIEERPVHAGVACRWAVATGGSGSGGRRRRWLRRSTAPRTPRRRASARTGTIGTPASIGWEESRRTGSLHGSGVCAARRAAPPPRRRIQRTGTEKSPGYRRRT